MAKGRHRRLISRRTDTDVVLPKSYSPGKRITCGSDSFNNPDFKKYIKNRCFKCRRDLKTPMGHKAHNLDVHGKETICDRCNNPAMFLESHYLEIPHEFRIDNSSTSSPNKISTNSPIKLGKTEKLNVRGMVPAPAPVRQALQDVAVHVRKRVNVVAIGHADSGKSTLCGHLLYKLGAVDQSIMNQTEVEAHAMHKMSQKFAWVLDKLKSERQRGMTIDVGISSFETSTCSFTLFDAPGHRDFIKNMMTGTSQGDCALLVIDCTSGAFEIGFAKDGQTREHAILAFVFGVKQIICCCNKIESTTPRYSKPRYEEVVEKVNSFLVKVGFRAENIAFIPISGFNGDNITDRSVSLSWYEGPTLLEALNLITEPKRDYDKPLRVPILDVYRIGGIGTICVGRVETGVMKHNMEVSFSSSGLTANVGSIEKNNQSIQEALPGDFVGFCVDTRASTLKDLKRGSVASDVKNDPAKVARSFISELIIINHPGQIRNGYAPILHCHTASCAVKFLEILSRIDRHSRKMLETDPQYLQQGDAGLVKMIPTRPMVVERFSEYAPLGRFAVRDMRQTVAVGVIKSVEKGLVRKK